ncbi:uncharacterized protein LOC125837770 [Solanum verrucosum]|uniref:uncharacterized protein LOC125837770 n=1 Tax=Solanum verrucosum TaxID=315347 RepID=UPI0020D1830F|nr:uncharacterized protein LOC125837770 [Solanum verrucosum]
MVEGVHKVGEEEINEAMEAGEMEKVKVISPIRARKLEGQGCLAYLAYIQDVDVESPSIESILIVSEFKEVFPSDFPGMPLDRDIDFCIDLKPGTLPISIAPYCMAKNVIAYASRQLKVHERNYSANELELAAVVFALKIWRYYLYSVKCEVFIDHRSLQHVFTQNDLNLRQRSWASQIKGVVLSIIEVRPTFIKEIKAKQFDDENLNELGKKTGSGKAQDMVLDAEGVLSFKGKTGVPVVDNLIWKMLTESHGLRYSIHLGVTKIYRDLKRLYWWPGMKKGLVEFVAKCRIFQQVKYEHQSPAIRIDYNAQQLAKIYVKEIVRLHMMPLSILSNHGTQFTSMFWRKFHDELGTPLTLSTTFHPQMDGQSERTIQVYHSSIDMAPFEELLGIDLVKDAQDKVRSIQAKLLAAHGQQKKKMRTKEIKSLNVQWKHRPVEEANWETEKDM